MQLVSQLFVHTSELGVSVRRYAHTKNGFRLMSFEKIKVLDSFFVHRYIIIKHRSSLIWSKIHHSLWEL